MVQRIAQDFDSARHQKNMTQTQRKVDTSIKEGTIVNSCVKDNLISFDETRDLLLISESNVNMPDKIFEKETKKNNPMLPVCISSISVMALLGIFTGMMKNFSKNKLNSSKEFLLPGITRNHCINNEVHQSIFSAIQSPNRKTMLASLGVITLGSMAFLTKALIDGVKDVWVKKREADIQKELQENLIDVERQSFSGKYQIIRSMLHTKAQYFSEQLNNNISFKNRKTNVDDKNNNFNIIVLGGLTLVSVLSIGYMAMRNIRKSNNYILKGIDNTKQGINKVIEEFNNGKVVNNVQGHNGENLSGKDAYKYLIENMLDSIYAKPEEIEVFVNKMNLPQEEKEAFIKNLNESVNQATEKVNSAIGGSGRNKITYFSHVNDSLSFFYDWLMNPNNPQFKSLFLGIAGASGIGYCGKVITEAVKDVQVKKYNAQTELDLQKRLVSTELRNFKAKKEAVIEPLCDEFARQKLAGKSQEELKIIADNILYEIKNGAPYVYS